VSYEKRAILTVEASIVVPLFLIAITLLLSFSSVFYVNEKIEASICEEAKLVALLNYNNSGYGISGIRANVLSRLSDGVLSSGLIKDGYSGFDFSQSDLSDREIIQIVVKYVVVLPFDLFGVFEFPVEKKLIMHSWTGYEHGLCGDFTGCYVYMTENGTVYHRSRECSHLKLKIRRVSGEEINELRNNSGAKYKRCIYCKPNLSDGKLYITSEGDKYHNTLSCSGLKRTVKRVNISNIGNIKPCLRCGY